MHSRRSLSLLLPALLLTTLTPIALAAPQNPQNRITSAVKGNSRVAVPGNVSGHVKHAADLGAAPADLKLDTLTLRFNMTAAQQADLDQLLAAQLNPGSPIYHQWLTPEQFGARFGLSASDLAAVSSWLIGQGFTVTGVARSSTFINFTGTVAQAEQAFGTSIHTLSYNGEQHISNITDPILPTAVAAVVTSITGLDDFRMKPHSRSRTASPVDPAQPLFTQTVGSTTSHYMAPADIYTIYDYPFNFAGGNLPSATNVNGNGVTIAVMGQSDLTTGNVLPDANIATFRAAAGLPPISLTLKLAPHSADPGISTGDIDEAHLDIEWSGAAAPGASILYYYGADVLNNSLTQAIDNAVAPILTVSYGLCESSWGTAALASYTLNLEEANVQGQTVISSAGDAGATDCDVMGLASEGRNVDFPGSSPYVTSAGGTMFCSDGNTTPTNCTNPGSSSTYWNSNGTGGGSAISYIPEQPWNETTPSQALTAGGAGGGGASGFFSKPAWQADPNALAAGVPNDASRDVPDISFNAAALHDGYLVCSSGSAANEPVCANNTFLSTSNTVNVFGGTSFVAPSFAGVLALVEQKLGPTATPTGGLGNIGPILYGFLTGPTYSSVFHAITNGNNSVPCSQGTLDCPNGGSVGYSAGPNAGYNQASGIGSIDVGKLVSGWASVTPTGTGSTIGAGITTTTITTNPPTTTPLCGISTSSTGTLPLTVTVTGSSGSVPSGTVQILVDNVSVASQSLPTPAVGPVTVSITLNTSTITSGGHVISAVYSGDGNNAGSKGTLLGPASNALYYLNGSYASVDFISGTKADFSITPCVNTNPSVSVAPGATSTGVVFTITPVNGFTGTVNLTATNNDGMISTSAFTPPSVNITTGALTTSFVIKAFTTAAQSVQPAIHPMRPQSKTPWYAAASGATLAGLLLFTLPRRRRWSSLLILMLSAAALTAVGCGSSSSNTGGGGGGSTPQTNAQAGTYTFTITAVSGSTVHSTQLTVTVP